MFTYKWTIFFFFEFKTGGVERYIIWGKKLNSWFIFRKLNRSLWTTLTFCLSVCVSE